jgi:hypothetical protein
MHNVSSPDVIICTQREKMPLVLLFLTFIGATTIFFPVSESYFLRGRGGVTKIIIRLMCVVAKNPVIIYMYVTFEKKGGPREQGI